MDAGRLVRETRLAAGLDQATLARRAGTTQTYISRIERGAVSPTIGTLERLLHAMGRRLALAAEPLPAGNASAGSLRGDLQGLTAQQRLEQAMELSSFLTGLAAAPARPGAHG